MHYQPVDSAQDDPRSRSLTLARALEQNLRELIELRAKVRKAEEELAIRQARPSRGIATRRARK